jgi:hypothetical protein
MISSITGPCQPSRLARLTTGSRAPLTQQVVAEGGGEDEDRFLGFAGGAQQAAGGGEVEDRFLGFAGGAQQAAGGGEVGPESPSSCPPGRKPSAWAKLSWWNISVLSPSVTRSKRLADTG